MLRRPGRPHRAALATLIGLLLTSVALAGAPHPAAAASCFPQCAPNDPGYDPAASDPTKTWNDGQWYLWSHLPSSAPIASDPENSSGMFVDSAWKKFGAGRDDVLIAYMEGGVNWRISEARELRLREYLNTGELPYPQNAQGLTKPQLASQGQVFSNTNPFDLNDDGVVNVDDYKDDPRVFAALPNHTLLHASSAGGITTEDLIVAFGHCQVRDGQVVQWPCPAGAHVDNDGDGYANDISGWNFHRDTNDPQTDQSIYAHSDDESAQAVAQVDNNFGGVGLCPFCRVIHVKAGDEAIDRPDRVAEAIVFAVNQHVKVIVGVIAALGQTPEMRAALDYAYRHNVVVAWASNDFESADHTEGMRYPHLWPGNSVTGDHSTRGSMQEAYAYYATDRTFRSRSTLTSYGPHALFSVPNNDGSTSTGTPTQGGVAALVIGEGLNAVDQGLLGYPLTADEVKQVVRATASNIDDPTLPFPGLPGATFNIFYGYGRPNVLRAMQAVHDGLIPPSADIVAPDWYENVDPTVQSTYDVSADVSANRAPGAYTYEFQYGLGPQPLESQFVTFATGSASGAQRVHASLDLSRIPQSFWGGAYSLSSDRLSIERYDVTIRVRVHDSRGLTGEDRRAFHVRHDDTEAAGFPVHLGTSGESSPTLADIEGRGWLDTVVATADGHVHAIRPDGTEAPGFPVRTGWAPGMDPASDVNYLSDPTWRDNVVPRPHDGISGPTAVADLFHTGALDIVATTLSGRVYAWDGAGHLLAGFPVQTSRVYEHQPVPSPDTPYTRGASPGALAAPVLYDLEGRGQLDIIQGAWDGHVYAWRPDGSAVPGWPVSTDNPNRPQNATYARDYKEVENPSIAVVAGKPWVIVPLQDTSWPNDGQGAPITAYVEAFTAGGSMVSGWPVGLPGLIQGYGTAQDFVTEGVTSPVIVDLPTGPTAIVTVNLFTQPYAIDLQTRQVRPFGTASISGQPGGPMAEFTTSPTAGRLLPGSPYPQITQAGSAAADVAAGVVEVPGAGVKVENGIAAWDPVTGVTLPQDDNPMQGLGFFTAPAVADVVGDGGHEIIESGDSGALMAWDGRTGQTAAGFPKWTGGWGLFTPAVGDVSGTGTVDVAQMTREGDLHLFHTPGLASANTEAWHWHQDDRNTGHYGQDTRPPSAVRDLVVTRGAQGDTLTFTAPGDDWNSGTAARYQVFRSDRPITQASLGLAESVPVTVAPAAAGTRQSITVPHVDGKAFYAVRAVDTAGNIGPVPVLSDSQFEQASQGRVLGLADTAAATTLPLLPAAGVVALLVAGGRRRRVREPRRREAGR